MAWHCTGSSNTELISNLFRAGLITQERVRLAMYGVDRAHYCTYPGSAYEDSPQSIGWGATISAPHMHAAAAENLLPLIKTREEMAGDGAGAEKRSGPRILDIGSGSGYLVHVFANLISSSSFPSTSPSEPYGKVIGIDHIPSLVAQSRANMSKSAAGRALLESGTVELICGDGRKGWAEGGPYDAIHVGAAAVELHAELIEQLGRPGRMFIPVEDSGRDGGWGVGAQWIWIVDKDEHGNVKKRRDMGVRYVPLTDAPR